MARQTESRTYKATVTDISPRGGRSGPYAVTWPEEFTGESVIFYLSEEAWEGDEHPEIGSTVILSRVQHFNNGWRALSARPLQPEDQGQ